MCKQVNPPEIVFISDLHLHPDALDIQQRLDAFFQWISQHLPKQLYILGDLFHVWVGDDCVDDWLLAIAARFHALTEQGVKVYFMPGNRDFLLGDAFAKQAGFTLLVDPTVIQLAKDMPVLLAHGDAFCLLDTAHQRFRKITRHAWFSRIFLMIPRRLRHAIVMKIRKKSQQNHNMSGDLGDVVPDACIHAMQEYGVHTLIHGHTHRPGLSVYNSPETSHTKSYQRYVLSDWDDNPQVLCYYNSEGLMFVHPEINGH